MQLARHADTKMAIPAVITVNGTDVDGPDGTPLGVCAGAYCIERCSVQIKSLPSFGTLHALQADGTASSTALGVDDIVAAINMSYVTQVHLAISPRISPYLSAPPHISTCRT